MRSVSGDQEQKPAERVSRKEVPRNRRHRHHLTEQQVAALAITVTLSNECRDPYRRNKPWP